MKQLQRPEKTRFLNLTETINAQTPRTPKRLFHVHNFINPINAELRKRFLRFLTQSRMGNLKNRENRYCRRLSPYRKPPTNPPPPTDVPRKNALVGFE